jgi:hypothetical protein
MFLLPFKSKQICSLKVFLPIAKAWNLSGLAYICEKIKSVLFIVSLLNNNTTLALVGF